MGTESPSPSLSRNATVGAGSSLRAFQESGGFEATFARWVHTRLRLSSLVVVAAVAVLLATTLVNWRVSGLSETEPLLSPSRVTLGISAVVAAAIHVAQRRTKPSGRALVAIDAAQTFFVIFGATAYYATGYLDGPVLVAAIVGLLLVGRAVFVPSPALRTFLLSLPASPAMLAVPLAYGTMYSRDGHVLSHGSWVSQMLWDQVFLWIAIGLATLASHINFALRLEVHEAAKVGQYKLLERLGTGAMGEVWRAQHGLMRRPTAVKIIRADVVDQRTLRRFEEEVRQTCRLTHPAIVAIYDYGRTADGVFFYAMELLDGVDLQRAVEQDGPMPAARVIHVLAQACAGLAEAHARGLVHRDVKAANLFLCERGLESDVVKVVDFGLVKDVSSASDATQTGEVCGTPETMAPETIRGRPAAPPVDVYALGAVGYWLVTGKQIFDATHAMEFVAAHLTHEPVPPSARLASVPRDLEEVLLACLRKDPAERVPSVLDLRARLLACADAGRWTQDDAAAWWRGRRERAAAAAAVSPAAAGAAGGSAPR